MNGPVLILSNRVSGIAVAVVAVAIVDRQMIAHGRAIAVSVDCFVRRGKASVLSSDRCLFR